MAVIKWYKRDPQAALNGMMVLSLEERGAYNTILDLIYSHDNNLIDDDYFIAGWMRVDIRVWRRIKNRLLELGKIECQNGLVTNFRATSEVDEALSRGASVSELNRIKGIKSGISRNKNNDLIEPTVEPKTNTPTPTPTPRKKEGDTTYLLCESAWNEFASRFKIPKIQNLSEARRSKLKLRLFEIGGLQGWETMIEIIKASPHLLGENERRWTVTFDWVLESKNLTKIMEGNYRDRSTEKKPNNFDALNQAIDEAIRRENETDRSTRAANDDLVS